MTNPFTCYPLRLLALLSCAVASSLLAPPAAQATPRPLPFTYPVMTLPKGRLEVEQYTDLVPVRIERELLTGDREGIWSLRLILQTEIEYAVTDRLELAFYFQFRQRAAVEPALRFDGIKQRLRYRFGDPGAWPVDVGIYFELAEFQNEVEFEQKLLLSRRFGALSLHSNLWFEQEYYFQDDDLKLIYNPTIGAAWEVTPAISLGLEYWVRGRFDSIEREGDPAPGGDGTGPGGGLPLLDVPIATRHFLGPTFLAQSGEYTFSAGFYTRLDGLDQQVQVGDQFGRFWVRVLVGVGL